MRRVAIILALLATFSLPAAAQAGWAEFWYRVHIDWHRMNCWPEPFVSQDRTLVTVPLIAMTDRGWQLQNTLNDHFFDPEEQRLTRAGQIKLRWIATQAPLHRRAVYVLRGSSDQATQARVASIQKYLDDISPAGTRPSVYLTDVAPPGGSGDYFDQVDRQLKSSIPAPRLPSMQGGESGGK
mgnify:CR=1 FL=1